MRLVLDTNAYVALRRGETGLISLLESADWLGIPTIVIGELVAGFLIGTRSERNLLDLDAFLSEAGVEAMPIGRNEAERYGTLVKALRERGTPIPTNDLWIASSALCADARLVTADAHFAAVPSLVTMGW
jgi:predicted nucleic acid-binding protein